MNKENIYIKCEVLSGFQVFPGDLNLYLRINLSQVLIFTVIITICLGSTSIYNPIFLFFFDLPIKHVLKSHKI